MFYTEKEDHCGLKGIFGGRVRLRIVLLECPSDLIALTITFIHSIIFMCMQNEPTR